MASIFELIRRDHERIRAQLREIREAPTPEARLEQQGRLTRMLRVNDEAEHSSLYSALLARKDGQPLASEGADAQRHIERCLEDLIAGRPGTTEHDVTLQELSQSIEHHFQWEQERLFPAAHLLLDATTLDQVCQSYVEARQHAGTVAA